jgi:hypothetical protein
MSLRHPLSWALAFALLGPQLGCGDDGGERTVIPCDIREARCRSAIFALTADVRAQDNVKLPPTRIITRQQFADETRAAVASSMSSREGQIYEAALRVLRFLPASGSLGDAMAESTIDGVAAYYDQSSKAITIIDDSAEDVYSGSLTLSHEYTHALQDQREVIDDVAANARSTDETMAVNALIEGEATILSDVAMARAALAEYRRDDVLDFMSRLRASLVMRIEKSDAPFNEALQVLPYPVGGLPIAEAYLASGIAGVQRFYSVRPTTLTGWVELPRPPAAPAPLTCDSPDAPFAYERINFDRFGGSGLIALLTRVGLDGSQAFETARAWSNDAFTLFAPVDAAVDAAFAWRIRLRDEASAQQLENLLGGAGLAVSVLRVGSEIRLAGASKPEVLTVWTARHDCSTQKGRAEARRLLPQLHVYSLSASHAAHASHAAF